MGKRLILLLSCAVALSAIPAFADIPFSSSGGGTGTVAPGVSFSYDFDCSGGVCPTEADWGIPGVGAGLLSWPDGGISDLELTFALGSSTFIDPAQIGVGISVGCPTGSSYGGTIMCVDTSSGWAQWTASLISSNSIAFYAPPGGNLTSGESFFVNVFFGGADPYGAAFSGTWTTPEAGTMLLLGTGLLGLAGLKKRRKLA